MATATTLSTPSTTEQPTKPQGSLAWLREFLEIVRDYGMPTVAFGTGIYAFILVLQVQIAPELKAAVALSLTLLGLLAQLWVYSRENPRTQSQELVEQLKRMTDLVERLVAMTIKERPDQ
jgi:hypothetical protein